MLFVAHRPPPVVAVIPANLPTCRSRPTTFRYYGIKPPARISWLAVLISAGLHAGLLLGFNHRPTAPRHVAVLEAPTEMLMMPDLKDPEEDKPKELNDDEPAASVQVPMLQDLPTLVPIDAPFTQLLDPTVPTKLDGAAGAVLAIPLNVQHGRPDSAGIKNLFNMADLDRRPEPIVQTAPVFPEGLKREAPTARVVVGFIINAAGEVIMPYIISSSHSGFEHAALDAVAKWKFKPGLRGGRKVNTRAQQAINFAVVEREK